VIDIKDVRGHRPHLLGQARSLALNLAEKGIPPLIRR
jgi:hypothetical protein